MKTWFTLTLLSAIAISQCQAQLWQMNSAPFLYRNPVNTPQRQPVAPAPAPPKAGSQAKTTLPGEFKWVARIVSRFNFASTIIDHNCTATLVANEWVLTAAHCVKQRGVVASNVTIRLGRYNKTVYDASSVSHRVPSKYVYIHPYYGSANPTYDFALVRLSRPITSEQSPTIAPIALPDPSLCSQPYTGTTWPIDSCRTVATSAGWGSWDSGLDILTKSIVPTYYYSSCNAWRTARVFTEATLCGGGVTYGDVCIGDSGGPLMCRDDYDQWYLLGVTAYGDPDCSEDATLRLPAVYGRVCAVMPWIRAVMANVTTASRNPSAPAPARPVPVRPAPPAPLPSSSASFPYSPIDMSAVQQSIADAEKEADVAKARQLEADQKAAEAAAAAQAAAQAKLAAERAAAQARAAAQKAAEDKAKADAALAQAIAEKARADAQAAQDAKDEAARKAQEAQDMAKLAALKKAEADQKALEAAMETQTATKTADQLESEALLKQKEADQAKANAEALQALADQKQKEADAVSAQGTPDGK